MAPRCRYAALPAVAAAAAPAQRLLAAYAHMDPEFGASTKDDDIGVALIATVRPDF